MAHCCRNKCICATCIFPNLTLKTPEKCTFISNCNILVVTLTLRQALEAGTDEAVWLAAVTEWEPLKDYWVERLLPYLRDEVRMPR